MKDDFHCRRLFGKTPLANEQLINFSSAVEYATDFPRTLLIESIPGAKRMSAFEFTNDF